MQNVAKPKQIRIQNSKTQTSKKTNKNKKKKNNNKNRNNSRNQPQRAPKTGQSLRIANIDDVMALVGTKPVPMPRIFPIPCRVFTANATIQKNSTIGADLDVVGEFLPGNNWGPWTYLHTSTPTTFANGTATRSISMLDAFRGVRYPQEDNYVCLTPTVAFAGGDFLRRWEKTTEPIYSWREDQFMTGWVRNTRHYYNVFVTPLIDDAKIYFTWSIVGDFSSAAPVNLDIIVFDGYNLTGNVISTSLAWTVSTTYNSASIANGAIDLANAGFTGKSFYVEQRLECVGGLQMEGISSFNISHSTTAVIGATQFEYIDAQITKYALFGATSSGQSFANELSQASKMSVTGAWLSIIQTSGTFTGARMICALVPSDYQVPPTVEGLFSELSALNFHWKSSSGTEGFWIPWCPYDISDLFYKNNTPIERGYMGSTKIVFGIDSTSYSGSTFAVNLRYSQRIELSTVSQSQAMMPECHPEFMHELFGQMMQNLDFLIGENPNHKARVKQFVNKLMSNPRFKTIAKDTFKGAANLGLAAIAGL